MLDAFVHFISLNLSVSLAGWALSLERSLRSVRDFPKSHSQGVLDLGYEPRVDGPMARVVASPPVGCKGSLLEHRHRCGIKDGA